MWIHLSDAFFSIVAPAGTQKGSLLVRARARGDIERVFGSGYNIKRTPDRDYAYRALVPRQDVAEVIAERIAKINYPNFKNSAAEDDRRTAYGRCWLVMADFQEKRERGEAFRAPVDPPRTPRRR